MPTVRGEVVLGTGGGAVTLVANIGGLDALQAPVPMTTYLGVASTTIQVAPRRLKGTPLSLDSAGDAGFITATKLAALEAFADSAGAGTAIAYTDSLGNVGTVLVRAVRGIRQFGASQGQLLALHLDLVWATLTQRLGVAYSGG